MSDQRELKTISLEVKDFDSEKGTFTGLLSVYDVVDEHNDVVDRGAYTKTLQENTGRVPLLWQHDPAQPIGMLSLKDGQDGLAAEGQLVMDDAVPMAKTAYALLKAGVVRGLSIGYRALKKKQEDSIRRLKEIKLYEGSLVTIPANRFALVESVKSADAASYKDFADQLRRIQAYAMHYQMLRALEYALEEIRYSDMAKDARISATRAVIDQFAESYMAALPGALDDLGVKGDLAITATFPDAARATLRDLGTKLLTMAEHSPSTSTEAAGAVAPEKKTAEPEPLHSLLVEFADTNKWRF